MQPKNFNRSRKETIFSTKNHSSFYLFSERKFINSSFYPRNPYAEIDKIGLGFLKLFFVN